MWKTAINDAINKTLKNIDRFGDRYPHVSENGTYQLIENNDWTNGFWSGLLWLCYEYTGEKRFQEAATNTVESFRQRLAENIVVDHHDIGFLYSLSSKAQWILQKDESARQLTIQAADQMMKRWRDTGGYFQAWGAEGDEKEGGRIIIDSLMNLPLLYWATEQTGSSKYWTAAVSQADLIRRYIVRGDDSSYHTFFFDQTTGEPIGGATHQGYTNGSTWTRGQAWGIYGFALSYRYTKNPLYLETAKRMAHYFYSHLPADFVAYWDFKAPINDSTYRDSSASAIAAAGLLEILGHLKEGDRDHLYFEQCLKKSMQSLVQHYATIGEDEEGLIKRGSYHVRGGLSPDDFMIWGDYFYLETLMRMDRGISGFWYDRN